jgi:drug/metabolite transporter (DMT)-like permease
VVAGALLEAPGRLGTQELDRSGHGVVPDAGQIGLWPAPLDAAIAGLLECRGGVSLSDKGRELSELPALGLGAVDARYQQRVQQLARRQRAIEFLHLVGSRSRCRQQAQAPTPDAQISGRPQRVIGCGVAALLGRVDEVERDMAPDQRKLSSCLHVDDGTSKYLFAGTLRTSEAYFAGTTKRGPILAVVILGAVAAAVGWGISDYLGGDVSRREVPVFTIVAISELLGVLLLLPVLIARGTAVPDSPRMLLALLAGCSTTLELGLIYRALSRGRALITAPVGALGAAVAVTIGVIGGDRLSPMILIGLVCALAGSAISTWSSADGLSMRALRQRDGAICAAAAVSVGVTLTLLHAAGRLNVYWVTTAEHASTAASAGVVAAVIAAGGAARRRARTGEALFTRRRLLGLALIAIAGTGGDIGYVSASHRGALSIVAALASLYPIMTIVLGRVLRGHRAGRIQLLGVALALAGAVLLGAAAH